MRIFLVVLFVFAAISWATAQNHSYDTTIKSHQSLLQISVRDIDSNVALLNATLGSQIALKDTIDGQGLADILFPDFNNDGYKDIMLVYFGNNPIYSLYLFNPKSSRFNEIDGYAEFSQATQLNSNPKYYYSYHRAGCADMNWVSDLFKIINFKIIHVGHIDGTGCDFEVSENPQTIEIYKIIANNVVNSKLIAKLPYLKYIPDFGDKWSFIEEYWNKHYQNFQ